MKPMKELAKENWRLKKVYIEERLVSEIHKGPGGGKKSMFISSFEIEFTFLKLQYRKVKT
jgi:hypothetical protein